MIYRILRQLARLAFRIYFRKIYFIDPDHFPLDKPVILACNHPSAFLEACILAAYLPSPLHFLTRGDMFTNKRFLWFFKATNQVPIYRFRDGFTGLRENQSSFARCYDVLDAGGTVLIFSEAQTVLEKHLKPIQKGTAKLAFGALERNPTLDLHIVPVGVSYGDPQEPRSYAMFSFARPIALQSFWTEYQQDPKASVAAITEKLHTEIRRRVVHIARKEDVELVEDLLKLHFTEFSEPGFAPFSLNPAFLAGEMRIANSVNDMDNADRAELKLAISDYNALLTKHGLRLSRTRQKGCLIEDLILVVYSALVIAVAIPLNFLPAWYIWRLVRKKVKRGPFFGPILSMGGFFTFALYYVVVGIVLGLFLGWIGWLITFMIIMVGYFAFVNFNLFRRRIQSIRFSFLTGAERTSVTSSRAHCLDLMRKLRLLE